MILWDFVAMQNPDRQVVAAGVQDSRFKEIFDRIGAKPERFS